MDYSRPLPRRNDLKVLNLDASSSEDSIFASTPAPRNMVLTPKEDAPPRRRRLRCRQKKRSPVPLHILLKDRELGRSSRYSRRKDVQSQIRDKIYNNPLTTKASWVGASGDVLIAAWSPDGSHYAFGCSTDLDDASAQYNRRNNLLLGDFEIAKLRELPDHFVYRTEAASANMVIPTTLDPELYTTVTSVAFDQSGDYLYTASYDKTVKVWDVRQEVPTAINTLPHEGAVTHLVSSSAYSGSFVTGQSSKMGSIRVYTNHTLNKPVISLESEKAQTSKEHIYPSAVQLGSGPMSQYLLAGFAGNSLDPNVEAKHGDICLWDLMMFKPFTIRGSSHHVFDLSWHSNSRLFAAAIKPGNRSYLGDRRRTKTLIKLWNPLERPGSLREYECPAADINEVQFHPRDENYIVASCTNGASYVWDHRMHDNILHIFQHDEPIDEMRFGIAREDQDTGVRMAVWSQDGKRLLTGASDGMIKSWDILAASENALQGDVAQFNSGVMCGSWSPDHGKLLVGLAQGAIEILTAVSPDDDDDDDDDDFTPDQQVKFIPAKTLNIHATSEEEDSGIATSKDLLASQQIIIHPIYGAGKGPQYNGPYASYAHDLDAYGHLDLGKLLPQIGMLQLDEETRKQARRDGGSMIKSAVSKADIKIYRNAKILARARNVEMLGQLVQDREIVCLGKRDRGKDEEAEDQIRERGKERRRRERGKAERGMEKVEQETQKTEEETENLEEGNKDTEERAGEAAAEAARLRAELEEVLEDDHWFY